MNKDATKKRSLSTELKKTVVFFGRRYEPIHCDQGVHYSRKLLETPGIKLKKMTPGKQEIQDISWKK